jgi:predicted ATPase
LKIKQLHIKNFKSIVDLTINEPNPFTVFVGPNGSGKSNIFEALEFMALMGSQFDDTSKQEILEKKFGDNIVHFNQDNDYQTLIGLEFDNYFAGWIRSKSSDEIRESVKKTFPKDTFKDFISDLGKEYNIPKIEIEKRLKKLNIPDLTSKLYQMYEKEYINIPLFADKDKMDFLISTDKSDILKYANSLPNLIESPQYDQFFRYFSRIFVGKASKEKYPRFLNGDGSNLENVLNRILLNDEKRVEIKEWIDLFIPEFQDIEIGKDLRGKNELRFYEKFSNKSIDRRIISDGTFGILCLLTAVYQSDEPQFLCIEEPENGLNPYVIRKLVDFFRNACAEKGHYIWLNTHSQTLVECLEPEEVIVVDKINGETQIKQIKGMNLHGLDMAEVWLSGALGGGTPW